MDFDALLKIWGWRIIVPILLFGMIETYFSGDKGLPWFLLSGVALITLWTDIEAMNRKYEFSKFLGKSRPSFYMFLYVLLYMILFIELGSSLEIGEFSTKFYGYVFFLVLLVVTRIKVSFLLRSSIQQ